MELKDRIALLIEHTTLKPPAFAKRIGVKTTQAIYDLLSGKTKNLSSDVLLKIVSCFPQISTEWLVTGEGEMYKPTVQQTSLGDYSPNMYGSNRYGDSETIDKILNEMSEQRKIVNRTLDMLAKRDEQIDRLISLIGNKLYESTTA